MKTPEGTTDDEIKDPQMTPLTPEWADHWADYLSIFELISCILLRDWPITPKITRRLCCSAMMGGYKEPQ